MTERSSLGRYELVARLSAGGIGAVYRAVLRGPGGFAKTVAVKRLHPHLRRDPEAVAGFLREARLGASVRHVNVVPILDVEEDEEPFLVMELVEGENLAALLRRVTSEQRLVPLPIAVAIASDLLAGLHAVHEAVDASGQPLGLVHRDVSPQNVLVGTDGVSRVIDFGIARALEVTVETAGRVHGKIRYLAPEQLEGRATRLADVYSAAVVIWEVVTGTNLLKNAERAITAQAILAGGHRSVRALRPEAPEALAAVIARGLARDPDARFASAAAMRVALEAAQPRASAEDVGAWLAGAGGAPGAAARPPRRRALGLAIVLFVLGLGVALAFVLAPVRRPRVVEAVRVPSPAAASVSASASAYAYATESAPVPVVAAAPSGPALHAPRRKAAASARAPAPRPDCATPYVLLDGGRKHYRAECFP